MKRSFTSFARTPMVLAIGAMSGMLGAGAMAQQQDAGAGAEVSADVRADVRAKSVATSATSAAGNQPGGIAEVIVTAQKRRERASQVPSAISVLSQTQLENQHVSQLADLIGYLPSVQIVDGGTPGQTQISVRGIPTLGPGAVVGTYLDDTPLGSSNNFSRASSFVLDLLPYDVARIELLRGPQGTLYGASAMGGLLKYVTNDPDLTAVSGRVGAAASSVDGASSAGWEARGVINVPLIKDELALRASVANTRTPGFVDNAFTGREGINRVQQQYGRIAALWRVSDKVSVKLSGLRQKIDARDNSTVLLDPVTLRPSFGEDRTEKFVAEPFVKTLDYFSGTVSADLQWADLTAASSYSNTKTYQVNDLSKQFGVAFPAFGDFEPGISAFPLELSLRKFSQELRLASKPGATIEWLLNGFYTREASNNRQVASAQSMSGAPLAGLDPLLAITLPSTYQEKAVYGQLTYKITPRFDMTGGLRYARNTQEYTQSVTEGILLPIESTHQRSGENVLTYLVGPRFFITPESMLYGRVASGYRPGGPNVQLPGVPSTVNADRLVNVELGLKSSFFNRRATVEMALYQMNWRDIQLSAVSSTGVSYLANAGTARTRGLELSTNLRPIPVWRLGFNAAYTHARLTADAPAVAGLNGDALQGIPKFTGSLTSDYTFDQVANWTPHAGFGYSWTGTRNTGQSSDLLSIKLPSYGLLNANADISRDAWTVRIYAKNLANSKKNTNLTNVQNALTGAVNYLAAVRPQPRTIGVEVDMSF